jgi:hypothetical protein
MNMNPCLSPNSADILVSFINRYLAWITIMNAGREKPSTDK